MRIVVYSALALLMLTTSALADHIDEKPVLSTQSSTTVSDVMAVGDFPNLTYTSMRAGQLYRLSKPHGNTNTDSSGLPYFAFSLPFAGDGYTIDVSSFVKGDGVFVPLAFQLDADFQLVSSEILISQISNWRSTRDSMESMLSIDKRAKYLVITTIVDAQNAHLLYPKKQSINVPVSVGTTTVMTSINKGYEDVTTALSLRPSLELNVPDFPGIAPGTKFAGWFIEMGVNFGGAKVADNPKGDHYGAGTGAVIGVGYAAVSSFSAFHLRPRVHAAYRYQGGDGNASGFVFQSLISKTYSKLNVSAGIYADLAGKVESVNGVTTKFKSAFGPQVLLEYRATRFTNLYLRGLNMNYKGKTDGLDYDGAKFGLGLTYNF